MSDLDRPILDHVGTIAENMCKLEHPHFSPNQLWRSKSDKVNVNQ